jgi:hypothetical protein
MSGALTELTEIATALGTLGLVTPEALGRRPPRLLHVSDAVWQRVVTMSASADHRTSFERSFHNGSAFLESSHGLRGRLPLTVEWKGPHRPPGEEVAPADLRIDHVYFVSCKYLSTNFMNTSPSRLFDRLLGSERRDQLNWFGQVAPNEYSAFYAEVRSAFAPGLPLDVLHLTAADRQLLKDVLPPRAPLPEGAKRAWLDLSASVSGHSARLWRAQLVDPRDQLRMLWRMLRIVDMPYFVLGHDRTGSVRLRVASKWDWTQQYRLKSFDVRARVRGQPEVGWQAIVEDRHAQTEQAVDGHVEIRWSHGRLQGAPEAKIYIDTDQMQVPGYFALS